MTIAKPVSLEAIRQYADNMVQNGTWGVEEFQAKVEKNGMAYALEWAGDLQLMAARQALGQLLLKFVETKDITPEVIVNHFHEEVVRKAQWPTRSTSPMANMASEAANQARAEFLARFVFGR
jgi:hypothetical protein